MLPGVSGGEVVVIAVVALLVVGPKDLPKLLYKLGQVVRKARGMADGFREAFDEMARQSDLEDLQKEIALLRDSAGASLRDTPPSPQLDQSPITAGDPVTLEPAPTPPRETTEPQTLH